MKVFYARVSTQEQNEARQMKMMEDQKVEKVFVDKASGKNVDRKDFKAMMAFVREGDTVIVESIKMALEALEKQIPKKPIMTSHARLVQAKHIMYKASDLVTLRLRQTLLQLPKVVELKV